MKKISQNLLYAIVSVAIWVACKYVLLYTVHYSHLLKSDYLSVFLLLSMPISHVLISLSLFKKIFVVGRVQALILYFQSSSIYFFYSYLSYVLVYDWVYLYTPIVTMGPKESDILVEEFGSLYFRSKVSFNLLILSVVALMITILYKKYQNK